MVARGIAGTRRPDICNVRGMQASVFNFRRMYSWLCSVDGNLCLLELLPTSCVIFPGGVASSRLFFDVDNM